MLHQRLPIGNEILRLLQTSMLEHNNIFLDWLFDHYRLIEEDLIELDIFLWDVEID